MKKAHDKFQSYYAFLDDEPDNRATLPNGTGGPSDDEIELEVFQYLKSPRLDKELIDGVQVRL